MTLVQTEENLISIAADCRTGATKKGAHTRGEVQIAYAGLCATPGGGKGGKASIYNYDEAGGLSAAAVGQIQVLPTLWCAQQICIHKG